jgi:hypothetical protein
MRELRFGLVRYHTESEGFRIALGLIESGMIPTDKPRSKGVVARFLAHRLSVLGRSALHGAPVDRLQGVLSSETDLYSPAAVPAILDRIDQVSLDLGRQVAHELARTLALRNMVLVRRDASREVLIAPSISTVVSLGDGQFVAAPSLVASALGESATLISERLYSRDTLRPLLRDLFRSIADIAPDLPPDVQELLAADIKELTAELVERDPRTPFVQRAATSIASIEHGVGESSDDVRPIQNLLRRIVHLPD